MKRPQIIGLAIASVAGLLAFSMVRGLVNKPPVEKTVEVRIDSVDVLVAQSDISLGQLTNPTMMKWQAWPKETVSPDFITKPQRPEALKEFADQIARQPIMSGEPITKQKLIKAGQGGVLAAILPTGMRAISTKIKEETAAGALILPNDRVDVILTRRIRSRSGSEDFASDILFSNVRVLAIGQQIESKGGAKQADSRAATATLELTSRQAETMALANSVGEISLSLRSVVDADVGQGPTAGEDISASKDGASVKVLRYGTASRAYGVN